MVYQYGLTIKKIQFIIVGLGICLIISGKQQVSAWQINCDKKQCYGVNSQAQVIDIAPGKTSQQEFIVESKDKVIIKPFWEKGDTTLGKQLAIKIWKDKIIVWQGTMATLVDKGIELNKGQYKVDISLNKNVGNEYQGKTLQFGWEVIKNDYQKDQVLGVQQNKKEETITTPMNQLTTKKQQKKKWLLVGGLVVSIGGLSIIIIKNARQ